MLMTMYATPTKDESGLEDRVPTGVSEESVNVLNSQLGRILNAARKGDKEEARRLYEAMLVQIFDGCGAVINRQHTFWRLFEDKCEKLLFYRSQKIPLDELVRECMDDISVMILSGSIKEEPAITYTSYIQNAISYNGCTAGRASIARILGDSLKWEKDKDGKRNRSYYKPESADVMKEEVGQEDRRFELMPEEDSFIDAFAIICLTTTKERLFSKKRDAPSDFELLRQYVYKVGVANEPKNGGAKARISREEKRAFDMFLTKLHDRKKSFLCDLETAISEDPVFVGHPEMIGKYQKMVWDADKQHGGCRRLIFWAFGVYEDKCAESGKGGYYEKQERSQVASKSRG